MTGVLAGIFPDARARLEDVALEASLSRLYAGIHYRFDMEAGLALGRGVASLVADRDELVGRELFAGELLGGGVVHVAERALRAVTEQPPLGRHRQHEQRD
jgi:hypothetical protein